jgi:2',3'-cyclic-nucleotide 2'-phosphodiesterase (5'-nucleotidase family)
VGGFAHLKTLVDRLRGAVPDGASLLLDGGDTWQGSGTALWTRGMDMVEATNLLGVDIMTGHWEFTYLEDEVLSNIEAFNGEFVAQNPTRHGGGAVRGGAGLRRLHGTRVQALHDARTATAGAWR